MRYITKQAYINGLAARGVLRNLFMQKAASQPDKPESYDSISEAEKQVPIAVVPSPTNNSETKPPTEKELKDQEWRYNYLNSDWAKPDFGYVTPGLTGAGVGALVGALVQAARDKNVLAGAGIGAGIGGLTGAGAKYYNDEYLYPEILEAYSNGAPYTPPETA